MSKAQLLYLSPELEGVEADAVVGLAETVTVEVGAVGFVEEVGDGDRAPAVVCSLAGEA